MNIKSDSYSQVLQQKESQFTTITMTMNGK